MSLRETLTGYLVDVDQSTAETGYSAEELATVAEDILGYDNITVREGGPIAYYSKKEVYTVEDEGVRSNSIRDEPYEALNKAAEMLENNRVEVLEE
ncbi:MAG: hypothetical protein ABEJ95_02820 [Candidatus Nanohalobium sp.]